MQKDDFSRNKLNANSAPKCQSILNFLAKVSPWWRCAICVRTLVSTIIPPREELLCKRCSIEVNKLHYHQSWQSLNDSTSTPIILLYKYKKEIRSLIHKMKYGHDRRVAQFFGKKLAEILAEVMTSKSTRKLIPDNKPWDIIVPVPHLPHHIFRRGFKPTSLIAQSFCKNFSQLTHTPELPIRPILACRWWSWRSVTHTTLDERHSLIKLRFYLRSTKYSLANKRVLLIDDVSTSGSTIKVNTELLRSQGASVEIAIIACSRMDILKQLSF